MRRIQRCSQSVTCLVLIGLLFSLLPGRTNAIELSAYDLAAQSPWGLNTHLATRYPAPGSLALPGKRVAELGVGWAREDFAWPRIEPRSGVWDWRLTDEMVAVHTANNVHVLGRLGYSVGWATADTTDVPGDQSFAMPNLQAWERYIRATVTRYAGRVDHWEIWNEPDNAPFWKGAPDPKAYAQLLQRAYRTIKAVDPDAVVLNGGVSPFDTRYLSGLAEAGAWDAFDVLALHPYTDPISPEAGQIGPSGIGGVRGLLNRYGTKPIWVTEYGWESGMSPRNARGEVDETMQANYLVRGALQLLAQPEVEKVFWYNFHDDQNDSFGLFRFGNSYTDYRLPKAAFRAFTTLTHELAGARFVKHVDSLNERMVIESWEQPDGWKRASEYGKLQRSTLHAHGGGYGGRLDYRFATTDNDYAAFQPKVPLDLSTASAVGLWVYGNNSGHLVQVQLIDAGGEIVQFPLGKVGGPEWAWMQTSIRGTALPGNRLGGGNNNGKLDGAVRVHALVLDDQPNEARVQGAIMVDDLTAIGGSEVYDYRWQRGTETIDVVYAPQGAQMRLPTASTTATIVERDGTRTVLPTDNGAVALWVGPQPRYVHHVPAPAGAASEPVVLDILSTAADTIRQPIVAEPDGDVPRTPAVESGRVGFRP